MTYAAIYIKPDKPKAGIVDAVKATTIQGQLKQAFNTAKNNIKNFDLKGFANNLTLEGVTDFTQKYATAGLTKIINGEPITNQSMMDGLFNGFAPAIDMTAVQMGYNSVKEMQVAVKNGNINVANFMQGFSGALSTVVNNKKQAADYSYLGDEITIDMIIDIDRQNIAETPDRRVQSGQVYNEYIHILPKVLSFTGKIKDGGKYTADEYEEILDGVFQSKKPFTFRAGEKVFENYVFTSFIPANNFEQSLNFSAEIKKIGVGEILIQKVNIPKSSSKAKQKTIKKNETSQTGNEGQGIKNKTTPKKLYGIGRIINLDQGVADIVNKLNEWK
ncbi:MAG: phage baseplate protein [Candidatus Gastranaerophilaceae bacterium]